jgi:hypothetical protein
VLLVPTLNATWDIFQERIDTLAAGFDALLANGDPWTKLPNQLEEGQTQSRIFQRLEYLRSQMRRLAYDWSVKWNIGYGSTGG